MMNNIPCEEKDDKTISVHNYIYRDEIEWQRLSPRLEVVRKDGDSGEWYRQSNLRRLESLGMCLRIGSIVESSAIL